MLKESESGFAPLPDETAMAQMAYSQWERAEAESMAEYISRRRAVDLAALVRQIVDEELTDSERTAIRMRYEENLQPVEIARRMQVSKTTASRALDRGEARIRRYLKYVVQYQYDLRHVPFLPLAVREAMVVYTARYGKQDAASLLRQLRAREHLSAVKVADAVSIPTKRLRNIEDGKTVPDAQELLRLAAFYGVCADSILKGDTSCRQH